MIVNGYCKEVFRQLPMEFAVEAQKLLGVSLEGALVSLGAEILPVHRRRPINKRNATSCTIIQRICDDTYQLCLR